MIPRSDGACAIATLALIALAFLLSSGGLG
jgi:hypothetical protein